MKETLAFTTEINQLMHLVIDSLYSNREIFLRELISNASDACDKLRFESLSNNALLSENPDLKIFISLNKENKTITIKDNGVGMSRQEVIDNIGTIAKSGTKEFLAKQSAEAQKDNNLIGQFGVGFYSGFIVADNITLKTRRAGCSPDQGVIWASRGNGEYTLENATIAERGTEIILHIKESASEFLELIRLKTIITKYSDHITIPVFLQKMNDDNTPKETIEWEQANKATALWARPKAEITPELCNDLYKDIAHDFYDPLEVLHNRVEGNHNYITLFFIPSKAPFDLWRREHKSGIKLYVKRTYIMDDAEHMMPNYLRFVKGIVDSSDLPLNVSREILQNNKLITNIRSASVKKILSALEKMAGSDTEKYATFWKEFGKILKEGPAEDFENRERIAKLLRFKSTSEPTETLSLEKYVGRIQTSQEAIYYLTCDSYEAGIHSPHLEIFKKKNIEVLLLCDHVDEWLMAHLPEFDKKKFQSVTKGDLDLSAFEDNKTKEKTKEQQQSFDSLLGAMKKTLGASVQDVRITHRLTESPACVVADANDMDFQMQRIMESMGQSFTAKPPIFEINPEHALIERLNTVQDDARLTEWTHVLFDQAILAEGGQLKEPAVYVNRLNKLLMGVAL